MLLTVPESGASPGAAAHGQQEAYSVRRTIMKKIALIVITGFMSAVVLMGSTGALAAVAWKYNVVLKPVPVKNSQGTPTAVGAGSATITLYPVRRQICWSITVRGIKLPAKSATLENSKGEPVTTLTAPASNGRSVGCARKGITRSTINSIHGNSKHYLVKVTSSNGSAVLRGSL
jgi:hypothetical protein